MVTIRIATMLANAMLSHKHKQTTPPILKIHPNYWFMNKKIQIKIVYIIEVIFLIPTTETAHRNIELIFLVGFFKNNFIFIMTNQD